MKPRVRKIGDSWAVILPSPAIGGAYRTWLAAMLRVDRYWRAVA